MGHLIITWWQAKFDIDPPATFQTSLNRYFIVSFTKLHSLLFASDCCQTVIPSFPKVLFSHLCRDIFPVLTVKMLLPFGQPGVLFLHIVLHFDKKGEVGTAGNDPCHKFLFPPKSFSLQTPEVFNLLTYISSTTSSYHPSLIPITTVFYLLLITSWNCS